jgi:hypothetical protein
MGTSVGDVNWTVVAAEASWDEMVFEARYRATGMGQLTVGVGGFAVGPDHLVTCHHSVETGHFVAGLAATGRLVAQERHPGAGYGRSTAGVEHTTTVAEHTMAGVGHSMLVVGRPTPGAGQPPGPGIHMRATFVEVVEVGVVEHLSPVI